MHIFFSTGEPSGDQHAAHLVRALRERVPGARFSGFGGPQLEQAGAEVLYPLTEMAVMGITAVLPLLKKFYDIAQQGRRFIKEQRPDAVVLIDFPGFNWHIAKYAKQAGIPVYYYCPPQLWAYRPCLRLGTCCAPELKPAFRSAVSISRSVSASSITLLKSTVSDSAF